jgi:SAM-dependent methyltransferase
MSKPDYFAAQNPSPEEQLRLRGLEMLWDPVTRRRLIAAGIGESQRCLEVGAGGGSVARMMAELTQTRVVAGDMDPRFLDPGDARYEIRKLDITSVAALEGELFDVIHCRFLLMHLPDPVAVLRTFSRRLAPRGFLLVEEPNMRTWKAVDPTAPDADLLDRVIRLSLDAVESAGVWRNALGPRLRGMLEEVGFTDVESEGVCWVAADHHPEIVAVITQTLQLAAESALAARAISQSELEAAIEVVRARKVSQITPTLFGAVGRRQH